MPKQDFLFTDYMGPVVAAVIFAICLLVVSFLLLNYCFVLKTDELTVFERFGSKHNVRLGPHSLDSIKRRSQRRLTEDEGCPIVTENTKVPIPQVQVDAASTS
ncbi:unnamed protein product [Bursaphelenchus xylophilus]|uniref:(pine wood nematode) hypothetical protein n=1 Tax=Bursaphelenchus xylophilus TaxID=6326 RepID=A0A1I7RR56_BURXY|nr:unnamed protein product [Bursaphelenchus xylophilus]CAG9130847.1 unnamed protein product [Bursaphelenchus xylophilus]